MVLGTSKGGVRDCYRRTIKRVKDKFRTFRTVSTMPLLLGPETMQYYNNKSAA
jgi:hypothetical protein